MLRKTKFNTKAVHLIVCIFFAVCLWFYVSYVVFPEVTKPVTNIPVTIIGEDKLNDNNLSAKLISDSKVDVKVTAKRTLFKDITLKNARATVDVSSITGVGQVTLKASVAFLSVPSANAVINTDKAEVTFIVETYDEKELTVTADLAKEPTDGYYINEMLPKNESDMTVIVAGGAEDVAKVISVKTEKIDLSDATDNTTKDLVLLPVDENGKEVENVKLSHPKVSLTFEIYKEASVPLSLELAEGEEDLKYTIEPAEVLLRGPASIIDGIGTIWVKYRTSGRIDIPDGAELVEGEPTRYEITLTEEGE